MDEKTASAAPFDPTKHFLALEDEYSSAKRSKVTILQVPYEKTTTYLHGTKDGPAAIIKASRYMEMVDDELNQETFKIGIATAEPLSFDGLDEAASMQAIYAAVADLLKAGKFPVILGGEHSVTPPVVKAFSETYPDLSVLHLDAHYDLRNEFFGSKNNHGCAARRITEHCPLVQVGMRSLAKEEKEFLNSQSNGRVKAWSAYDILETPMWQDKVVNALTEHVYITIDLDVFDPAIVKAVGTPEPGGIGWYEILALLKEVAKDKKVVGFDIVELCPMPHENASDYLAAKLLYRLLGYVFGAKK